MLIRMAFSLELASWQPAGSSDGRFSSACVMVGHFILIGVGRSQRTEDENLFCPSYCCHHHFILLFVAIITLPVITTFLEFLSMQHRRLQQLGADCYCYSCHSYVTVEGTFYFKCQHFYVRFSPGIAERTTNLFRITSLAVGGEKCRIVVFSSFKQNTTRRLCHFLLAFRVGGQGKKPSGQVRIWSHYLYWKKKKIGKTPPPSHTLIKSQILLPKHKHKRNCIIIIPPLPVVFHFSSFHFTSHIHPPNISHPCPCSRWMRMLVYEPWLQLSFMLVFGGYNVEKWNGVVPIYPFILDMLIIIIIIIIGFLKLDQEPIIPS